MLFWMRYRFLLNPFIYITFGDRNCATPADEMVLETALNGRADALVTLNIADFAPAGHFRLPVLTPGVFLRRLEQEKT